MMSDRISEKVRDVFDRMLYSSPARNTKDALLLLVRSKVYFDDLRFSFAMS